MCYIVIVDTFDNTRAIKYTNSLIQRCNLKKFLSIQKNPRSLQNEWCKGYSILISPFKFNSMTTAKYSNPCPRIKWSMNWQCIVISLIYQLRFWSWPPRWIWIQVWSDLKLDPSICRTLDALTKVQIIISRSLPVNLWTQFASLNRM